jgi:hypothetical protein
MRRLGQPDSNLPIDGEVLGQAPGVIAMRRSAILRIQPVRFEDIELTWSVRSFQDPDGAAPTRQDDPRR